MHNWTKREQTLVDICFQIALTLHTNGDPFRFKKNSEVAEWVADQLNQCGFPNVPVGSSWGHLVEEETFKKIKDATIRNEGTPS